MSRYFRMQAICGGKKLVVEIQMEEMGIKNDIENRPKISVLPHISHENLRSSL